MLKMGIDVRCKREEVRGKKEESILVDDESQPSAGFLSFKGCKSMKKHTLCIGNRFFLLPLHPKYDKSYSNGYWKSHKRA